MNYNIVSVIHMNNTYFLYNFLLLIHFFVIIYLRGMNMKKITILILILLFSFTITSCGNKDADKEKEEIENIILLIDNLPTSITLDDEEQIVYIELKYEFLSIDGRSKVTNYDKLLSARSTLNILKDQEEDDKKVNNIINLIDQIPDIINLKLADEALIINSRNGYNQLDNNLKNKITNLNHLEQAEERLIILKQIDDLINEINKLADVITLDDEEMITNLENIYTSFIESDQALVTNYDKLKDALEQLEALYVIENLKTKAKAIIDIIDALPSVDDLTLDDQNKVKQARARYQTLSAAAKPYVTNLAKLEALEAKLQELLAAKKDADDALYISSLIAALPSVEDLTLDDKDDVEEVRLIYNAANNNVKSQVTNLAILEALETRITELIAEHEYVVKLYPVGGYLEGGSTTTSEQITSFKVDNYSTGFFTGYATNIYIYKTSLMSKDDSFINALKVGFDYSSDNSYFVVTKIVPLGTPLTEAERTSEYFILVHTEYKAGYDEVSLMELGDHIKIDKTLPTSQATSLNLSVNVFKEGLADDYYEFTYKGITTLPIPTKDGYIFKGWYMDKEYLTEEIKEISDTITLYAKWAVDHSDITTDTILNCISDVVNSDTVDDLILSNNDASFEYISSNDLLYHIDNDKAYTSKIYQTHKKQEVTVTINIKYKNGNTATKSKKIIVNPVTYKALPDTPVATYFYTDALSSYRTYSARYKEEGTIFSSTTKEALDLLYYSFATPDANGNITVANPTLLNDVNNLKEHDIRTIMVINGVGSNTSKYFYDLTKDATLLKTFIKNIMDTVELYHFDGVDLDWEYVSSSYPVVASQVNALVKGLREEMDNRQDSGGTPYFLSAAIPSSSWGLDTSRWDFPTLNNYLDYINIMSYDANKTNVTTHLAPLYTSTYDNGYGFGCSYGVERIAALGFARSKLIIGSAGYGKAYIVNGTSSSIYPGLGVSGTLTKVDGISGSFASGTLYGNAIDAIISKGGYTEYIEKNSSGQMVGSYLYNKDAKIFITYDSSAMIKAKYQYAKQRKGVGIMCWAYTEDTSDHVINAIYEEMHA